MKYYLRYLQTLVPGLQDWKFAVLRIWRKWRGRLSEPDFAVLCWLELPATFSYLDIGTNRGDTILDVHQVAPHAQILGFEPNPNICQSARALTAHLAQVKILNIGLGQKAEDLVLYVPEYRGYQFDGLASVHRQQAADWLKTRMFRYRDKHLKVKEITCTFQALDSFLLKPDFIKMDVQGHELAVLEGGEQMIRRNLPILLLESATDEIANLLISWGYQEYFKAGPLLQPGRGGLNSFFLPPTTIQKLEASRRILPQETTSSSQQRSAVRKKPSAI